MTFEQPVRVQQIRCCALPQIGPTRTVHAHRGLASRAPASPPRWPRPGQSNPPTMRLWTSPTTVKAVHSTRGIFARCPLAAVASVETAEATNTFRRGMGRTA